MAAEFEKINSAALESIPGAVSKLEIAVSKLRRGALSSHVEQVSALGRVLDTIFEANEAKSLAVGQIFNEIRRIAHIVGSGSSSASCWPARNLCLRALALLKEEAEKAALSRHELAAAESSPSLAEIEARIAAAASLPTSVPGFASSSLSESASALLFAGQVREGVLDGLAELQGEVENVVEGIAPSLPDLFRPSDVVLLAIGSAGISTSSGTGTISTSSGAGTHGAVDAAHKLLLGVILAAAKERPFELLVNEGGPGFPGAALASAIAGACAAAGGRGVSTTLVADASVIAIMPRVTKVVIPALAVAADGSIIGPAGVRSVCVAAVAAGIPVLAIASLLHVCAESSTDKLGFGAGMAGELERGRQSGWELLPPSVINNGSVNPVEYEVLAPLRDSVPARLISVVVTDVGCVAPGGVRQLVDEHYCNV